MNKRFIYWVRIRMIWSIIGVMFTIGFIIADRIAGYEIQETFYLLGLIFVIWYIIKDLIELFQPMPIIEIGRK